jgi:hypothetical protein
LIITSEDSSIIKKKKKLAFEILFLTSIVINSDTVCINLFWMSGEEQRKTVEGSK